MKLKTFEQYLDALRSYFSLLVIFVLLSRSLQVSCCLQVQVIKHRPKQMQKAYPGLLEPGYSYNISLPLLQTGHRQLNLQKDAALYAHFY